MRAIAVEDERLALESLRTKLASIGRIDEVSAFTVPEEALAHFAENGADVAFLDIQMPRMDGLTLASKMRELRPDLAVIFITGYSEYSLDAFKLHADGYLMKPMDIEDIEAELDALMLRRPPAPQKNRVRVQCFGEFEIFADGAPIPFPRSKSKELLAYLVDRRGAACPSRRQADILWDDGIYDRSRQKQLSTIRREMIAALRKVGAGDIVTGTSDAVAVDPAKFDCDYYSALAGDAAAKAEFMGEYMAAYSWAEPTTAALTAKLRPPRTT